MRKEVFIVKVKGKKPIYLRPATDISKLRTIIRTNESIKIKSEWITTKEYNKLFNL